MGDSGVADMTASRQDRTHFIEKGERIVAKLVAEAAGKIDPRLKMQDGGMRP